MLLARATRLLQRVLLLLAFTVTPASLPAETVECASAAAEASPPLDASGGEEHGTRALDARLHHVAQPPETADRAQRTSARPADGREQADGGRSPHAASGAQHSALVRAACGRPAAEDALRLRRRALRAYDATAPPAR